jgi:hypothetical protein
MTAVDQQKRLIVDGVRLACPSLTSAQPCSDDFSPRTLLSSLTSQKTGKGRRCWRQFLLMQSKSYDGENRVKERADPTQAVTVILMKKYSPDIVGEIRHPPPRVCMTRT